MKMIEKKDQHGLDTRDFAFEVKVMRDDGAFTGYASVFGVMDDGMDIVQKGAFLQTLSDLATKGRKVPMLWAHRADKPIGTYPSIKEDDRGLLVEGKFTPGVALADETRALMRDGAVNGLSIGFRTKVAEYNTDTGVRTIKQVDLFEISVVTFPMLDVARAVDVKSNFQLDPRALERELKELGEFSNSEAVRATAIVKRYLQREAEGAKSKTPARDEAWADEVLASLREARASIS